VLDHRDLETRFFGNTAATLRHAAALATLPGSVVELGVRFGTSTRLLQFATGLPVHGFDTFSGLPQAWHTVPRGAYSTAGVVPELGPLVHLHKGLFSQTLPGWVERHRAPLRLLHVDCDLYESTAEALHLLAPLVAPGTVVLFDEYLMNPQWTEDEHKALVEVGQSRGWTWRYAAFSLFSHQAVVVITGT
jgi:predicted O-methyltransferase YrrM